MADEIKQIMADDLANLAPCPFCGNAKGSDTRIRENKYWTGLRFSIISIEIGHFCPADGLPRTMISVTGKTIEQATARYNIRHTTRAGGDGDGK